MAKRILIHLDGGIGDIIMGTPCVNALVKAGHEVDVYVRGDTYKPIELFRHWSGPRHVASNPEDFIGNIYDYYLMGSWVYKPVELKNPGQTIVLNGQFTKEFAPQGSKADLLLECAKKIDPNIDINMPSYCGHSKRIFPEITRGTVVLFPGCKKEYPMKRWDKFDQLADQFVDVAVVGTNDDLYLKNSVILPEWVSRLLGRFLGYEGRMAKTVRLFGKKYNHDQKYSNHVKNYIGQLSLSDTAALISQAGLFIGNDGGLSHIAAALKVPTYVISGPTDPRAWNIKGLRIQNISMNLDCQPCFHKNSKYPNAWKFNYIGCPIGMKCMAELKVEDILNYVTK